MLLLAKRRCAGENPEVEFIESSAHPMKFSSETVDAVVCQQGFQFFPERTAAATEIFRVLRKRGMVVVTTWRTVDECELFGKICDALTDIGETVLSDKMRLPFDFMPESELQSYFKEGGFKDVRLEKHQKLLTVNGGIPLAVEVAYSTPIGLDFAH